MQHSKEIPRLPLPVGEPMPQFFAQTNDSTIRVVMVINATSQLYVRAERSPDAANPSYNYTLTREELQEDDWWTLKAQWTPTNRETFLNTLKLVSDNLAKAFTHFSKI